MSKTLYEYLKLYADRKVYPFHMPGHKGRLGLPLDNLLPLDITEIPDFDNLHNPQGIIRDAQRLMADTFGADETFFSVNGSTASVIASILTSVSENEKIIVARNSHKSVYTGLILSGAIPFYVYPKILKPFCINESVSPDDIELAFIQNNDIKAVVITSPTYEGVVSDIEKIAIIAHKYNAVLIVDEAHGGHFKFNNIYPKPALDCGADIVIHSLHKTLPALTQCSLLHVKGHRVDRYRLQKMLSFVQTSSPSYILMASIDLCGSILAKDGKLLFDRHVSNLVQFRKRIQFLSSIELLSRSSGLDIYDVDISRLAFIIKGGDFIGCDFEKILLNDFNIQIEMSSLYYFTAIATIADDNIAFSNFADALVQIDSYFDNELPCFCDVGVPKAVVKKSLRDASFLGTDTVSLVECDGRISADFIFLYPPGIPMVVPGEIITEDIVKNISIYKQNGIKVVGVSENDEISVIA